MAHRQRNRTVTFITEVAHRSPPSMETNALETQQRLTPQTPNKENSKKLVSKEVVILGEIGSNLKRWDRQTIFMIAVYAENVQ